MYHAPCMWYRYVRRVTSTRESSDGGLYACNFPFYPAPVDLKAWRPSAFPLRPSKTHDDNVTKRHILHRFTEPLARLHDKINTWYSETTHTPHTHQEHTQQSLATSQHKHPAQACCKATHNRTTQTNALSLTGVRRDH